MRPWIKTMLSAWAALIAAATMSAPAATATTATAAQDTLVLGVQAHGGDRFVTLRCDPPSGTHRYPESACEALRNAGGDFTKIPGQPGMLCPDSDDPVTAIASGDYQGRQVMFRHTYPNRCDLARHTASVFQL